MKYNARNAEKGARLARTRLNFLASSVEKLTWK